MIDLVLIQLTPMFCCQVVEDQIKLIEEQKKLQAELQLDVVGMSLFDTVVVVCLEKVVVLAVNLLSLRNS